MKRKYKIILLVLVSGIIAISYSPGTGANMDRKIMKKYKNSPNFKDGRFQNQEETVVMHKDARPLKVMKEFMKKRENGKPPVPVQTEKLIADDFIAGTNQVKYAWLGHSTVLINFYGTIIITDPFLSERSSPVSFAGTKKFSFTNDYIPDELPDIDIVLISHDHYDHLDHKTVKALDSKVKKYITPLGVAAHLKRWGVDQNKISEIDWWEESNLDQELKVVSTPARHFSGRKLKRNTTQWCSFVIQNDTSKVYFSGDSGYGKHFKEIGDKYGPIDIAMLECGQYNKNWSQIHMMPEETWQAALDLKAKNMLPLHWAKLELSLHSWTDPVERLIDAASTDAKNVVVPKIGEILDLHSNYINTFWWRNLEKTGSIDN